MGAALGAIGNNKAAENDSPALPAPFKVEFKRITEIEQHPKGYYYEIASIEGGYRTIIKKGAFQKDDLIAYIPAGVELPDWLLQRMGFWSYEKGRGKLYGNKRNMLKTFEWRGQLAEGICLPVRVCDGTKETKFDAPLLFDYTKADLEFGKVIELAGGILWGLMVFSACLVGFVVAVACFVEIVGEAFAPPSEQATQAQVFAQQQQAQADKQLQDKAKQDQAKLQSSVVVLKNVAHDTGLPVEQVMAIKQQDDKKCFLC